MDSISRARRSIVMSRIRARDTGPERALRAALWKLGVRGWRLHQRSVIGTPDIVFRRLHLAVFVDGRFWHGHPRYFTPGKSGAYWDSKIAKNRARDKSVTSELRRTGWTVLRFWDFTVEANADAVARRIAAALDRSSPGGAKSSQRAAAV